MENRLAVNAYRFGMVVSVHSNLGFNSTSKAPRSGLWSDDVKPSMGSYSKGLILSDNRCEVWYIQDSIGVRRRSLFVVVIPRLSR